jgi:GNAT superfamily N-acetyltransferase
VGTVLPHGDAGPSELGRRVAAAEAFYADYGTAARFQITPGACPDGLDDLLAARGYRRESPMSLQMAPVFAEEALHRVRVEELPTRAWFEVGHRAPSDWDMLRRVQMPSAYASVMDGDDVIAVGRAVADGGWAGLLDMATLENARGRGAAHAVLAALADWAGRHGAGHLYLQVGCDNTPALRLYERAGFAEVCRYHYRRAASAD